MVHENYFEGVLQLRNPTEEILDFVAELCEKRGGVQITKEKPLKNGVDYYFVSQKFLQVVGKQLKMKFEGEFKLSSSLHTRDTNKNKDLYRINILFKCYPFKIGDVVDYNGEDYKIVKTGDKITGKHVQTGKNRFLDPRQLT